jgi:non-specific serine/threonine protein kinase
LKPANVLVREDASGWHPRLVDFGSGRVLDPGQLEALGITRLGLTQTQTMASELTGTPLYLAPELLGGQVPTVRSDIYALGVMLFQLCVGDLRRPLSAGWENEIDDALLREDIASAANGNPQLRFDSAHRLAESLRSRGRRAQVAQAQREQAAHDERLRAKSRRRRRWLAAAFASLVCGLIVAIGMYRQVADANARAEREARIATTVNRFLNQDVLAAANPMRGGHVDVSVRQALDAAAPNIDVRFAGLPQIAATLHRTLGDAYYQLSDFPQAVQHFDAANAGFAAAEGDSSVDTVGTRALLAQALVRADRLDEAAALIERISPQVQALAPEHPMLRVQADMARAWLAFNTLHIDQSIAPLEEAAQTLVGVPDADPEVVSAVAQALVSARSRLGLPAESLEQTQQRLLAKMESQQGRTAPATLGARHPLARIQVLRGKGREMESTYLDLVRDFNRVLGPEKSTLLVTHGLANVYAKLERWDDCARNARIAYEGLNRRVGPSHINTLNALDTLALAEYRLGRLDEASRLFESGMERLHASQDKLANLLLPAFQINLAYVRLAQGRREDAAALITDARKSGGTLLKRIPTPQVSWIAWKVASRRLPAMPKPARNACTKASRCSKNRIRTATGSFVTPRTRCCSREAGRLLHRHRKAPRGEHSAPGLSDRVHTSSDAKSPFVSSHSLRSLARFFDSSMSMTLLVPSSGSTVSWTRRRVSGSIVDSRSCDGSFRRGP